MKKTLLLGVALAAVALSAPASAELKFKPGEDSKFNWANFEDLKKVELLDQREHQREAAEQLKVEQSEYDEIGRLRFSRQ